MSEEEAGGGKDCVSASLSPPTNEEAVDAGPEVAPPATGAPLLYS